MEDRKIKHLELIQNIISRMANNSFVLKGWAVTLISAIFVLSDKDSNKCFFILVYFPVVMFWILDSYFLAQEKYFRDLYNEVRKKDESSIDFSMKLKSNKSIGDLWMSSALSPSVFIFYIVIIILLLLLNKFI